MLNPSSAAVILSMFLWYGLLSHDAVAFPSTTNAPPTTLFEPFLFVGIVTMISALPEQAGGLSARHICGGSPSTICFKLVVYREPMHVQKWVIQKRTKIFRGWACYRLH
jgi:hypothetical protein